MLNDAFERHLISNFEMFETYIKNREDIENFYVMLLSIHAKCIEEVYDDITRVYNSSKVEYAEGTDLDDIGVLIDCSRPQATKAGALLTFTLGRTPTEDITIPAGLIVTSSTGGISYETAEPLFFATGSDNTCETQAYCTVAGVKGRVGQNQLTKLETRTNVNSSLKVTNESSSTGGTEAFTDDEYRELLKNWIKVKQRGNEWAYYDYFSRQDGIEDYKLIPNWDGTGTIKIIVSPSSAYVLNKLYSEIQSEVTQASEDIVLLAPVDKEIDVYVNCNVDIDRLNPYSNTEKDEIKSRIESAVRTYIDQMKIGENFIPHKLGVFVDNAVSELKNISFTYPAEVIEITDEEECVAGDIEINME